MGLIITNFRQLVSQSGQEKTITNLLEPAISDPRPGYHEENTGESKTTDRFYLSVEGITQVCYKGIPFSLILDGTIRDIIVTPGPCCDILIPHALEISDRINQ